MPIGYERVTVSVVTSEKSCVSEFVPRRYPRHIGRIPRRSSLAYSTDIPLHHRYVGRR